MCFISTFLSSGGIYDKAVTPQTPCKFPWIKDSFLWWKLFHPNTSKPLCSDFVFAALHKRFLKSLLWNLLGEFALFFVFLKSCKVPDWTGSTPKANFFLMNWFVSVNCLRNWEEPACCQEEVVLLNQCLVWHCHTICLMSRSSSRADCKGAEGWGAQGWKKNQKNLLSFDLLGANLQMLWNLFILLTLVEL